ncbi:MAG: ArsI/CadI family heavy metal resistance metalloenzyme [Mucilaginibacter sp.]
MHVSLYVSDIQTTVQFYNSFFGQAPGKIRSGYAKYILDEPSLIISFVENAERVQQHFGHLGFQVETIEELNERLEKAQTAGLLTREETGTSCCYARQDKFWVADPDGIQWEVYYFHADAEFNDPHYEEETAAACCVRETVSKQKIEIIQAPIAATCCGPTCCS